MSVTKKERQRMMTYLGSNWYLGNKKVTLTPRESLNLLRHNSENLNWRAVALEVWNYFVLKQFRNNRFINI